MGTNTASLGVQALVMKMARLASAAGELTAIVVVAFCLSVTDADKLCYACNSYMTQCQQHVLAAGTSNVFQARCASKCFTRQGEDDDNTAEKTVNDVIRAVKQLTDDYVGCRNQTWNNRVRRWCLCDSDLCNTHAIGDGVSAVHQHHKKSQHSFRSRSGASIGSTVPAAVSSASTGISTNSATSSRHHIHAPSTAGWHPTTVGKLSSSLRPTIYRSHVDVSAGYNASERRDAYTNDRRMHHQQLPNPAEYRTVWNNWRVDEVDGGNDVDSGPPVLPTLTATDQAAGSTEGGRWVEAPRGVLHSVHHDHPHLTTKHQGFKFPVYGSGAVHPGSGISGGPFQGAAKSAENDRQVSIEPIPAEVVNVTEGDPGEGYGPSIGFVMIPRVRGGQQELSSTYDGPPRHGFSPDEIGIQRKMYSEEPAILDDDSVVVEADGGNETQIEVLEYPYNQEFSSHPVDWTAVEYIAEPEYVSKEAPKDDEDDNEDNGGKLVTVASFEDVDYPYNQFLERLMVHAQQNAGTNEDSDDGATTSAATTDKTLKEGAAEVENGPEEPPAEKSSSSPSLASVDYPYNQMIFIDGVDPVNSEDAYDGSAPALLASNSSSGQSSKSKTADDAASSVTHTIHTSIKAPPLPSQDSNHRQVGIDGRSPMLPLPLPTVTAYRSDQVVVHHRQPFHGSPFALSNEIIRARPPADAAASISGGGRPTGTATDVLHLKSDLHSRPLEPQPMFDGSATADARRYQSAAADEPPHVGTLKTKYGYAPPFGDIGGQDGAKDPRRSSRNEDDQRRRPLEAKEGDNGSDYERTEETISQYPAQIVPQIRCAQTGYYQNPKDCTQFVACLFDHNTHTKVLHLMRCPSGLVWDNHHKLCMETSSTCNEALSQADLDNNYVQFFADLNAANSMPPSGGGSDMPLVNADQTGLLNNIKNKNGNVEN